MSEDERRATADVSRRSGTAPTTAEWFPREENPSDPPPIDAGDAAATDAASEAEAPRTKARPARLIREIVETLLLALVIFVGVRLVVLNFRVDGSSMFPNLHDREMLLVNRNVYFHFDLNELQNLLPGDDEEGEDIVYPFHPPERGDIVVFNPPGPVLQDKPYIKRVIGLPGETVTFESGRVLIDGTPLEEPYIGEATDCSNRRCQEETVGEGEIYVLGDNRDNSQDSRAFGAISVDSIIGKAWFTYWPLDDLGLVPHYDYPGFPER